MPVDGSTLKWNKDEASKAKIKEAIVSLQSDFEAKIKSSGKSSLIECGVDHAAIDALLRGTSEKFGLKLGDLTQPLRLHVTGQANSAIGLFDLLPVLPWSTLSLRLKQALE